MNDRNDGGASRRTMLRRGLAGIAAATTVLTGRRARSQEKIAQAMVQYQQSPKDGHQCSECAQFIAPSSCKIVDGMINPNGWCIAFAAKT